MKKTCLDCLHCKVLCISKKYDMLCYCSMSKNKEPNLDIYWSEKKMCKNFSDMSDDITLVVSNNHVSSDYRLPLINENALMRA